MVGRIKASTFVPPTKDAAATPRTEAASSTGVQRAVDTFEPAARPNDLAKSLGGKTAELPGIVEASLGALPKAGEKSRQPGERYGTTSSSTPNPQRPDRFGLGPDPEHQDPIAELNRKAGFGFDPRRDLRISPGDAASKGKESDKQTIQMLVAKLAEMQARLDMLERQILMEKAQAKAQEVVDKALKTEKAKNPNPEAPDNTGGGPFDPLVNNLGTPLRVRQPFVDPQREEPFGPSGVMKGRDQAVDPNPDADPNVGAARRAILSTADAVTDPPPDTGPGSGRSG